jgi:hypothetical protein
MGMVRLWLINGSARKIFEEYKNLASIKWDKYFCRLVSLVRSESLWNPSQMAQIELPMDFLSFPLILFEDFSSLLSFLKY